MNFNQRQKIRKAQIKPLLKATFPEYRGRTFYATFTTHITIHDTNWGGGTRSTWKAIRMDGGKVSALPSYSPWNNPTEGAQIELEPGIVIIEHCIFCGKDLGIRFYAHPSMETHLLTA